MTVKLLYICHLQLWNRRVSASRRHDMEAISRHPDVEFQWTGPGWPDWDDRLTGCENIKQIMPNANAVIGYKIDGTRVSGTSIPPIKNYRDIGGAYLLVEKIQEAWHGLDGFPGVPFPNQAVDRRVGLAILSHENDLPRMEKAEAAGVIVKHIPHSAEATVFGGACKPWEQRDIDVVLTGTIGSEHYPLRARWLELLDRIRCHDPALRVTHYPRPPHLAANLDEAERCVWQYAETLGRAKFVLGCSSKWKYALARFPEAAAAGAVHISDVPDDACFRVSLGKHMIPVSAEASDAELVEAVAATVSDQDAACELSEQGHRLWREHFTQENFADRFVKAVKECL